MVLLIVDVQKLITCGKLYNFEAFKANIKLLISNARQKGMEVVYVRHYDAPGEGALAKDQDGFQIYDEFKPNADEKIFDKNVNSAFKNSGLHEYLKSKDEKQLIIAGLMTEYCIDATIKCGFEHGFEIFVPEYSNSTFNNEYMTGEESYKYYNKFIWNNRYAKSIPMEEALELMNK